MDKEAFEARIKEIGTCEDASEQRAMLGELLEEAGKVFDDNKALTEENAEAKEKMEALRSANQRLFVMVGSNKSQETVAEEETGIKEEKKPEPRKFTNLFDEKGNFINGRN